MKNWLTLVENSRESLTTSRVDSAEDRIIGLKDLDKISEEYIYIYAHTSKYVHTNICKEYIHTCVYVYIHINVKNIYIHIYVYTYLHGKRNSENDEYYERN